VNILFMCVANSARSQLAEALAKRILGSRATVMSAGSNPTQVHQMTLAYLAQQGLPCEKVLSKSVNDLPAFFLNSLDYVITLCAEEVCPVLNGISQKLHWPVQDPAKEGSMASFETTAKLIEEQIRNFAKIHFPDLSLT